MSDRIKPLFLLCVTLLFGVGGQLLAQTKQRVKVVEYLPDFENLGESSRSVPLPHVTLQVKGAGSAVTGKDGTSLLLFSNNRPGDLFILQRFVRPGYELLNPEELLQLHLASDPEQAIVITLISSENMQKRRDIMTQVGKKKAEQYKQQEISVLDPLDQDYVKQLAEIEMAYKQRLDKLENYVAQFSKIDFSRLSEVNRQPWILAESGDIDGALDMLDRAGLMSSYEQSVRELKRVRDDVQDLQSIMNVQQEDAHQLEQQLLDQVNLLIFEGSTENSLKAMSILEHLLSIDQTGMSTVRLYMTLCIEMQRYEFADSLINLALKRPDLPLNRRVRLSGNLARLLFERQRYDEAWDLLEKISKSRDSLLDVDKQSPLFLAHGVIDNSMMGFIRKMENDNASATNYFRDAFRDFVDLRTADQVTGSYDKMTYPVICHVIFALSEMNNVLLADSIYETTGPRVPFVFSEGSMDDKFIIEMFRMCQVNSMMRKGQKIEAMNLLDEVCQNMSKIYDLNPLMCERAYMVALRNLVRYHYREKDYQNVSNDAGRWKTVYYAMCDHAGKAIDADLTSEMLIMLGFSQNECGDVDGALSTYEEVLRVIERERENLTLVLSKRLGKAYGNMSGVLKEKGEIEKAQEYASRALELFPESTVAKEVLSASAGL